MRSAGFRVLGGLVLLLAPGTASAQPPRVEVAIGGVVEGGATAGTTRAELLDSSGRPVTLFEARHRTTTAPGLGAQVAVRVRARWAVAVAAAWSRPDLSTRITGDFEATPDTEAALGMHRLTVELGVERRFSRRGRVEPYARLSAGWLRELTTDRTLVDDGVAAHVGGGLKYWMRDGRPGWLGRLALRAEVLLAMRRGGLTLGETGTRVAPAVSAGLVIAR